MIILDPDNLAAPSPGMGSSAFFSEGDRLLVMFHED
jgi:hypothetical protein